MRITVHVKPRSRSNQVVKLDSGEYTVTTVAPPEAGKANEAVCRLLADHFGVSHSQVRVVLGKTAREKLVEISQTAPN